jgi:UDP-N-acetylmuramate--alanine ligase
VEVDESDKSISEFSPDYGVLLNVGDDHYERAELQRVFGEFLGRCGEGAAVLAELRELAPSTLHLACFSPSPSRAGDFWPEEYKVMPSGMRFCLPDGVAVESSQSGMHSAWNACAVMALLSLLPLGRTEHELAKALGAFQGVRQRFEYLGNRADGVPFVNDYAHNPEKISAAVSAARERFGSPLYLVFQPHGFKPLGFMREALLSHLAEVLREGDRFVMLPVFYAGGSSAFHPTSKDVAEEAAGRGLSVVAGERADVERELAERRPAAVLVMGARDSSLRPWTNELLGIQSQEVNK